MLSPFFVMVVILKASGMRCINAPEFGGMVELSGMRCINAPEFVGMVEASGMRCINAPEFGGMVELNGMRSHSDSNLTFFKTTINFV